MSWNYRVIKTTHGGEDFFSIHEAYYNRFGKISAISRDAMEPHGATLEELGRDLSKMSQALHLPVLVKNEIKFVKPDWEDEGCTNQSE